ncbi:MAG: hypothetical protein ACKPEA_05410, partial [Planctomycetota bacterium]
MNGTLDAGAVPVATTAGRTLWAGLQGDTLYVATQDAGEGNDVFMLLSGSTGPLTAAPWGKAGQAMAWKAFLADENDNAFCGWFNDAQSQTFPATKAASTGGNGGVLEGTIDLAQLFGARPDSILLAAVAYGNANGGALVASQHAPACNGNGSVEANEFVTVRLCELTGTCCPADLDGSGAVEFGDVALLLLQMGDTGSPADLDGSGSVDNADISLLLLDYGPCG